MDIEILWSLLLNGFYDLKIFFGYVIRGRFAIHYRNHHFNLIEIQEDMTFENIDYAISRNLEVRFENCSQYRIQLSIFDGPFPYVIHHIAILEL